MTEEGDKTSSKLFVRKSEISSATLKFQPSSRRSSFDKSETKRQAQTSSRGSADTTLNSCFGDGFEDARKETSEGVQTFIKQVSDYIEKQNSYTVTHSLKGQQKNFDFASFKDKTFEENFNIRGRNNEIAQVKENDQHCVQKLMRKNSNLVQSIPKKWGSGRQSKKNGFGSCADKRDHNDKKQQEEFVPTPERSTELNQIKTQSEDSHMCVEKKKNSIPVFCSQEKISNEPTIKLNQPIKRKPSEIPLRKNRTDSSKKPKAVYSFLQKSVKEFESAVSVDFYSNKNDFSPKEKVSLHSEVQINNSISSSDKLSDVDKAESADSKPLKAKEKVFNIERERCNLNPSITTMPNFPLNEFLEEKSSTGRKVKLLDLDKFKTSSFTVLSTSPTVLDRLECLHKQNVLAKEKMGTVGLKKLKPLTPKKSFSCIKRRSSRKSLLSGLSGKRKKSVLQLKVKKSRKETQKVLNSSEKCSKTVTSTSPVCISTDITDKKVNNLLSGSSKTESCTNKESVTKRNYSNEENSIHATEKTVRNGDKQFLQKTKNHREKEESKIPTPQRYSTSKMVFQEVKKSEKPKSPINTTDCKKSCSRFPEGEIINESKVGSIANLKPIITAPITLPRDPPDQSQILLSDVDCKEREDNEKPSKDVICETPLHQSSLICNNGSADKSIKIAKGINATEKEELPRFKEIEATKAKNPSVVLRKTQLNFGKDDFLDKQDNSKSKTKMQLKIDLNLQNAAEENFKNTQSCDWLFKNNSKKYQDMPMREERIQTNYCVSPDSFSSECNEKPEKSEPSKNLFQSDLNIQETSKSCSFLKGKCPNRVSPLKTKGVIKKIRSDAGDRQVPFSSLFSPNPALQNKAKVETKMRNGHTKSYNEEQQRDLFEEEALMKLRRRSSEPNSFTGYIWKRTDFPTFRGHKPSVSSMTSSLKHLNTDDIDDFIFWEPVPQKMTSCWEMSLYHYKKPWTVLSCSVFKDNRLSNTPGLILDSLRNGGNPSTRQSLGSQGGRVNCAKENPFDVEPSIAQKNIDIRNWLAALNFATPTPASSGVINEGTLTSQSPVDSENLNKVQGSQKRRKVIRNIKSSDEPPKLKIKEKKHLSGWDGDEVEGLRDLVRRKSGGFVIKEQHLDSKNLTQRSNATVNPCLASKSAEEKSILLETNDRNTVSESKVFRRLELPSQRGKSGKMRDLTSSHFVEEYNEQPPKVVKKISERILKGCLKLLSSKFIIWIYLFIFTLFIIVIHYYFLSISLSSSDIF